LNQEIMNTTETAQFITVMLIVACVVAGVYCLVRHAWNNATDYPDTHDDFMERFNKKS